MLLNIIPQTGDKVLIEAIDDENGVIAVPRVIHRYKEKDVRWLVGLNKGEWTVPQVNELLRDVCENELHQAMELDVSTETFVRAYDDKKQDKTNQPTTETETLGLTAENPFVLHVRGLTQLKSAATSYSDVDPGEALAQAFHNPPARTNEPVIEWWDSRYLVCLDIDYHNLPSHARPNHSDLRRKVQRLKCQPFAWHPSHGNGAKLYYVYRPGFGADELASVAGLEWIQADPQATFDLTRSSRHPCYPRSRDDKPAPLPNSKSIHFVYGSSDVGYLRRVLNGELEQGDIDGLLSERGWTMGQTLPHSLCPISPTDDTKENVFVGDAGLFCHRCFSRGLGSGDRPGFVPFGKLVGTIDNRIMRMCRNFCHLEHATIVLQNVYQDVPVKVLETVYRVLLKIVHSWDDPRIGRAMVSGKGYIRAAGMWTTPDGESTIEHGVPQFVQSLPATLVPTDKGFGRNVSAITALTNTGNVEEYGYQNISFIRGCRIFGQFQPYGNDEVTKVVLRREFRTAAPQYQNERERMPIGDAWDMLEQVFPGIDRTYLQLLIAMKGASEGRLVQCPFVLVNGVSGSGKSSTVHIAAGICGDKADEPQWSPHSDRFRQALMDASKHSEFLAVNEVFKEAARAKLRPTQAIDPMLTITEDSRSHKMYIGSVPFGRLPVFVLTDIDTPQEIKEDVQIARRFTFYHLYSKVNWTDTLVQYGIRPHQFRLISPEHNAAANSILSYVIDTYFRSRMPFHEITKALQCLTLEEEQNESGRGSEQLKQFYEAVCNAPLHEDKKKEKQFPPLAGWKRIDRIVDSPLRELWEDLCSDNRLTWNASDHLTREDLAKLFGLSFPIVFEAEGNNNVAFVRFRSVDNKKNPSWINGKNA